MSEREEGKAWSLFRVQARLRFTNGVDGSALVNPDATKGDGDDNNDADDEDDNDDDDDDDDDDGNGQKKKRKKWLEKIGGTSCSVYLSVLHSLGAICKSNRRICTHILRAVRKPPRYSGNFKYQSSAEWTLNLLANALSF